VGVGCWVLFGHDRNGTLTPLHFRRSQPEASCADSADVSPTSVSTVPVPSVAEVTGVSDATNGSRVTDVADVEGVTNVEPAPGPESEPATVVVVGGGTTGGLGLVTALMSSGHKVVAVEHDPYAATLRIAELGAVIPPPGDPQFAKALLSVAGRSGAGAVLAAGSAEMRAVAEAQRVLDRAGVKTWSPGLEVFKLCSTRSALYEALDSSGLSFEKTGLGPTEEAPGHVRQFNVDLVVGRDHELVTAVSSWRLATDLDTTTVAQTFFDHRLLELLRAVCASILIEGPVVAHGYVSELGRLLLSEVRPGFSPLVPLARAAGVDVVALALNGALGCEMPTRLIAHKTGVRIIRYMDQVFEDG
jgi:hypothetical protein